MWVFDAFELCRVEMSCSFGGVGHFGLMIYGLI
jgi:hypothetical protein